MRCSTTRMLLMLLLLIWLPFLLSARMYLQASVVLGVALTSLFTQAVKPTTIKPCSTIAAVASAAWYKAMLGLLMTTSILLVAAIRTTSAFITGTSVCLSSVCMKAESLMMSFCRLLDASVTAATPLSTKMSSAKYSDL